MYKGGDILANVRKSGRSLLLLLLCFLLVAALFFYSVIWGSRSIVSAPFLGVGERSADCYPHLADPVAGVCNEGPGLWLTHRYLAQGHAPLWNPYEACGSPYMANGEVCAYSVLQLPLHVFPSIKAWDLFVILRMVLAAWFAALLVTGLGFSMPAAFMAGIAYGFSGNFIYFANLVHLNTSLWLPLIVLAVEAYICRPSCLRIAGIGVVTALALNGGNPQPLAALSVLLIIRMAWLAWTDKKAGLRAIAGITAGIVLGILLAGVSLFPLLDMLPRSAARQGNLPDFPLSKLPCTVSKLLCFGAPVDFSKSVVYNDPPQSWYIGVSALALALGGMWLSIKTKHPCLCIYVCAGMAYGLITFFPPCRYVINQLLPMLRQLWWAKYTSSLNLTLIVSACFLFAALRKGNDGGKTSLSGGVVVLVLLLSASLFCEYGVGSLAQWRAVYVMVLVLLMIGACLGKARRLALRILPLVLLVELFLYRPALPIRPDNAYDHVEPGLRHIVALVGSREGDVPGRFCVCSSGKRVLAPLNSSVLRIHDIRSVSPVPLKKYNLLAKQAFGVGGYQIRLLPGKRCKESPLIDICGVRWLLDVNEAPGKGLELFKRFILREPHDVSQVITCDDIVTKEFLSKGHSRFRVAAGFAVLHLGFMAYGPDKQAALDVTIGRDSRTMTAGDTMLWRLNGSDYSKAGEIPFDFTLVRGRRMFLKTIFCDILVDHGAAGRVTSRRLIIKKGEMQTLGALLPVLPGIGDRTLCNMSLVLMQPDACVHIDGAVLSGSNPVWQRTATPREIAELKPVLTQGEKATLSCIVQPVRQTRESNWQLVFRDPNTHIGLLENKRWQPFVRFLERPKLVRAFDDSGMPDRLFEQLESGYDAVIETAATGAVPIGQGRIQACHYPDPNRMVIQLECKQPGWLYLGVADDGHWRARLNGCPVQLITANFAFMAVHIPAPGAHELRLTYTPFPFYIGVAATCLAALLICGLAVCAFKKKRQTGKSDDTG